MAFSLTRALAGGKAIGVHPVLMDRSTPVVTYEPGGNRRDAAISQREAPRHLEAYGGREAIDWVMNSIRVYADSTSTAQWMLEKPDGTKLVKEKTAATPDDVQLGPKELYDLLEQPNPFMDYAELVELMVTDLLLIGNGYWLKYRNNEQGRPLALYRMSPSHIKIIPGPDGPQRYEYQPPGAREPFKYAPQDVMHFRLPNPHNAYYGLGLIQGGGRMLDVELALADSMASYYENKADPSLIVQSERRIPRDVFNKLRAQLRARASGTKNAGELLALEAGLTATTLSPNARDALFDVLARMSRDRILAMFRISPMLLGIIDESAGSNKISDARREFDTYVLRPFLDKLQKRISMQLTQAWGVDFKIDYRYVLPLEELLKQGESVAKIPGIKVREIRRFYAPIGLEESTGDSELDELLINIPGENLEEGGATEDNPGFADQPLAGEAGRPPNIENTPTQNQVGRPGVQATRGQKALTAAERNRQRAGLAPAPKIETLDELMLRLDKMADAARIAEAGKKAVTLEPSESTTVGNRLPAERRPQDVGLVQRDADIDAVAAALVNDLQDAAHVLERGLMDHVEGKAFRPGDLVSRIKRSEIWKSFTGLVSDAMENRAREAASVAATAMAEQGVTPDTDVDYDAVARRLTYRPDGAPGITKTIRDSIVKKVEDSLTGDATADETNRVIREAIQEWRTGKAETIALTEAVHAYNEATLDVAEAAGIEQVVVTDGRDHDQPCQDADGLVWDIATARENRLEHPRCRRAFLPLTAVS